MKYFLCGMTCIFLLSSCSSYVQKRAQKRYDKAREREKQSQKQQSADLQQYIKAGGRVTSSEQAPNITAGVVSASTARDLGITAAEDVVWAPEDPNKAIGEGLETLWEKPESKLWHKDYKEASRLSESSGKPLLIWFTDTVKSSICRKLNDELFNTKDFDEWAGDNIIRLTIDTHFGTTGLLKDYEIKKLEEIKALKKRFSIMGSPTVLILAPQGSVIEKYRGYKTGDSVYYWGKIRHTVEIAMKKYGQWREKLEKKGYRMWTSRGGVKVFAKLSRYQPGKVTLTQPNGKRGITSFKKLSDQDQAWVLLQKKKYEQKKGH